MSSSLFPAWLSWLLLLAVIWLFIQVSVLQSQIATARFTFRNRQELEQAYTKGLVGRDDYEMLKERLS